MATRTFLFVDQVGSTEQLTRLGDAGALALRTALLDLLRQAVSDAGGHELDSAGDGLFCAFDGAADGVDAAVAMQQLTWSFNARRPVGQHLSVRVGLHTGEPLENADGGYFGAAVVVASRLCSSARADQVLASDLVRALVEPRGIHAFEPVGMRELKGVPEPVAVTSVRWEPPPRRSLPGELDVASSAPFVGRTRELATLEAAWRAVLAGGRRTVAISGDHGMGSTHLAAEFARSALERGASVLAGDARRGRRMGAWADAVTTWAASLARAELRIALGRRGGDLDRLVPGLAAVSGTQERPVASDADPFVVADALDEVLSRASGIEPVIVVLDHLEEADEDTLTVLRGLATSQRAGRLLVIACYEPSEVGTPRVLALLAALPDVLDVRLAGLAAGEVAELIEATTGQAPTPDRLRALLAESEGSPYFVISMAVAQRERDLTVHVTDAVERAEGLRADLRLQREEITLGLRQLEQLRSTDASPVAALVEPDGTPPADVPCPYKGLLSFGLDDAGDFHGRQTLVAELTARLMASRFLGVVGPSGSGKSSVVTAGLLPALARGAVGGSDRWVPVVFTPGTDALASLAGALHRLSAGTEAGALARRLATEPLGAVATAVSDGRRLVLVVDQGEELWTASSPASRDRVVDLLTAAADDPARGVVVVLVLRSDYYGRAAAHPALAALLTDSQVLVGPLTPGQLRAVVEAPARRAGLVLEPGLAQAVVDDAGDAPGALPLVSTALLETWQRRRGRSLTLAGYAEAGGVRRAIARLADATYQDLPEADRPAAQRLLLRLAAPGVDGDDVARRAGLAEVTSDDAGQRVLDLFTARRLVTVGADTVQVAHEALLREWPRLRGWLDADREGRRLHQQIAAGAAEWEASARDDGALLGGARLSAATDWREENDDALSGSERAHLDASVQARSRELVRARRSAQRLRVLAGGLVVVLIVALVAAGLALGQRRTARERADEAIATGLAGQAAALSTSQDRLALLLAVEGHRREASASTRRGLLTALEGGRLITRWVDHLPGMTDVAASPDGRTLFGLTSGGLLQAYDTTSWHPRGEPMARGLDQAQYLTMSKDGSRLFVVDGTTVHVYDTTTRGEVAHQTTTDPDAEMIPDEDGSTVAVESFVSPTVEIREVSSWALLGAIPEPDGNPLNVDSIRGTRDWVTAPVYGGVAVTRYRSDGSAVGASPVFAQIRNGSVITTSPDGRRAVVCGVGQLCQILDVATLAAVGGATSVGGATISDDSWSEDGQRLAIASDDGSITDFDLVAGEDAGSAPSVQTTRLQGLSGAPVVEWLSPSRLLAISSYTSDRAVYDVDRVSSLGRTRTGGEGSVDDVAAGPGGELWAVGPGALRKIDPVTLKTTSTVRLGSFPHGAELTASLDHQTLVVAGWDWIPGDPAASSEDVAKDYSVVLVDARSGRVLRRTGIPEAVAGPPSQDPSRFPSIALSPDGRHLAFGVGGVVTVVDVRSGRALAHPVRVDSVGASALAWSPDGRSVVAGGYDGVLSFLDPRTLRVQTRLTLTDHYFLTQLVTTPGRGTGWVSTGTGRVYAVDLRRRRRAVVSLDAGGAAVESVTASDDGRRVATTGADGRLRLWNALTGDALGPAITTLPVGEGGHVVFAGPSDERVISISNRREAITSTPADPGEWARAACAKAGRDLTRAEWREYLPSEPYRRTCPAV